LVILNGKDEAESSDLGGVDVGESQKEEFSLDLTVALIPRKS